MGRTVKVERRDMRRIHDAGRRGVADGSVRSADRILARPNCLGVQWNERFY
jgi:hypothetical protein